MNQRTEALYRRMAIFGAQVIRLAGQLPPTQGARIVAGQICRSSTSVGANYREAQRDRRKVEFVSKLQIALQESDETIHWLEVISQSGFAAPDAVTPILQEANELAAILVTSVRTTKSR